jgi:hypothetical protein
LAAADVLRSDAQRIGICNTRVPPDSAAAQAVA